MTRPAKAKEVKAWAVYGSDGRLVRDSLLGQMDVYWAKPPRRDIRPSERVVRVLITPIEAPK